MSNINKIEFLTSKLHKVLYVKAFILSFFISILFFSNYNIYLTLILNFLLAHILYFSFKDLFSVFRNKYKIQNMSKKIILNALDVFRTLFWSFVMLFSLSWFLIYESSKKMIIFLSFCLFCLCIYLKIVEDKKHPAYFHSKPASKQSKTLIDFLEDYFSINIFLIFVVFCFYFLSSLKIVFLDYGEFFLDFFFLFSLILCVIFLYLNSQSLAILKTFFELLNNNKINKKELEKIQIMYFKGKFNYSSIKLFLSFLLLHIFIILSLSNHSNFDSNAVKENYSNMISVSHFFLSDDEYSILNAVNNFETSLSALNYCFDDKSRGGKDCLDKKSAFYSLITWGIFLLAISSFKKNITLNNKAGELNKKITETLCQ